jgi:hypothetical protein
MDGTARSAADLDLDFSPWTNPVSIRHFDLAFGASAAVRPARPRLPDFVVEPLDPVYRRTGVSRYWYEPPIFGHRVELDPNPADFCQELSRAPVP